MSQSQKEAADYAEVLLAYSRGETIQMRADVSGGEWGALTYPFWDFARYQYRVAPKPVEAWVFLYASGQLGSTTWATKDETEKRHIANGCAGKAILMREVVE